MRSQRGAHRWKQKRENPVISGSPQALANPVVKKGVFHRAASE
jgi:hypothetical protein